MSGEVTAVVVERLEDRTPDHLPVLMVECDRCARPCWIEGGNDDQELMAMAHVCRPCMAELIAEDPSLEQRQVGNYQARTKTMPINPHYVDQATTAAAALMKAYRTKDKN
jgi:hypothetical protein